MKPTKLQIAVIKQLGYVITDDWDMDKESELWGVLQDVASHGADTGWNGFTYNSDTVDFTKRNRKGIERLVRAMADDFGQSPVELILSFNCLKDADESIKEAAGRFVYGGHYKQGANCNSLTIYNTMAWFALEETARQLTDY